MTFEFGKGQSSQTSMNTPTPPNPAPVQNTLHLNVVAGVENLPLALSAHRGGKAPQLRKRAPGASLPNYLNPHPCIPAIPRKLVAAFRQNVQDVEKCLPEEPLNVLLQLIVPVRNLRQAFQVVLYRQRMAFH